MKARGRRPGTTELRGETVPHYDIVMGSCNHDAEFAGRLGFRHVFRAGTDVGVVVEGSAKKVPDGPFIAIGRDAGWLTNMIKAGAAAAVVERNDADRKLLATMRDRDVVLLMPMGPVTGEYGLHRSRTMYFMQSMLRTALRMRVRVSFASMAESRLQMCSYMQLVELAKLVGASEKLARDSVSVTNRELGEPK